MPAACQHPRRFPSRRSSQSDSAPAAAGQRPTATRRRRSIDLRRGRRRRAGTGLAGRPWSHPGLAGRRQRRPGRRLHQSRRRSPRAIHRTRRTTEPRTATRGCPDHPRRPQRRRPTRGEDQPHRGRTAHPDPLPEPGYPDRHRHRIRHGQPIPHRRQSAPTRPSPQPAKPIRRSWCSTRSPRIGGSPASATSCTPPPPGTDGVAARLAPACAPLGCPASRDPPRRARPTLPDPAHRPAASPIGIPATGSESDTAAPGVSVHCARATYKRDIATQ